MWFNDHIKYEMGPELHLKTQDILNVVVESIMHSSLHCLYQGLPVQSLLMKRSIYLFHFSETTMFLIILLATSTVLIPLGLNQNQIAIAQQQKLQGSQNNQTSSSSLTKQQQPTGISFQIDNMTFSHHTASVNGIQLHYVIGGHGDPVVLLHGWPETWYEWHNVMPALAKNYTVIAPDLRGLGDSSKPLTGYDGKTVAEDIHQLVTQLGFKSIFLVGHDVGSQAAYSYAVDILRK